MGMFRILLARFLEEFGDDLFEIIKDKLTGRAPAHAPATLTDEQQKELDALITEIRSFKQESAEQPET